MSTEAGDWDARTYSRVAAPHERWAAALLDRLALRGDERVLDAGCGSGHVTRLLLDRLPRGSVIGVDASPAMLAAAREALAPDIAAGRATLVHGDLTTVRLPAPVESVFSNATFHWVRDQAALFANLAALMLPGGRLVTQCGGAGNVAAVTRHADAALRRPPFAQHAPRVEQPYNFATPDETLSRLAAAGFIDAHAWLEPSPQPFPDAAAFGQFLRTVVLRPYVDALPEELRGPFIEAVVAEDARHGGARTVDYVRLNLTATRSLDGNLFSNTP